MENNFITFTVLFGLFGTICTTGESYLVGFKQLIYNTVILLKGTGFNLHDCYNCTRGGYNFLRLKYAFLQNEKYICHSSIDVIVPQLLIIDIEKEAHSCETFPARVRLNSVQNEMLRGNLTDFQQVVHIIKGFSEMRGENCLAPIAGNKS